MKAGDKSGEGLWRRWCRATPDQARDTGLALVLICLILAYWGWPRFLPAALVLLLLAMVWPRAFRPLAGLWFGLSHLMGRVVSTLILSALFFFLVTPVGLVRRWLGADPLKLRKWKKDRTSVFETREGANRP